MIDLMVRRLNAMPLGQQLVILTMILDPLGFAGGYLLAPSMGVDPIMGGVYGLVLASLPVSFWVMRHAR